MLQNIAKCDSLITTPLSAAPVSLPTDTITLPMGFAVVEPDTVKSVNTQYEDLVKIARDKLPKMKTNIFTSGLLDLNKETKAELIKLIDDEKLHTKIKDYIKEHNTLDLKKMLHDKKHQDNLIGLVSEFAQKEKYANTVKLLENAIVKKALKSYLSDL